MPSSRVGGVVDRLTPLVRKFENHEPLNYT
jgi:hypothetical protein